MRNRSSLALLLACGCGADGYSQVKLALGEAPERVQSLSVFVVDKEDNVVVTSATVPPSRSAVQLSVPAERPLVFHAVARTLDPGPATLKDRMPAFAARAERVIDLGRTLQELELTLRPAGAVEILVNPTPFIRGDIVLRAAGEQVELPVPLIASRTTPHRTFVALNSGRWAVSTSSDDAQLAGSGSFYVAAESDNVVSLFLDQPEPESPVRYLFETAFGDSIVTSSVGATNVDVMVSALDVDGDQLLIDDAVITWISEASPNVVVVPDRTVDQAAIPQTLGFTVQGSGWWCFSARIVFDRLPTAHELRCFDVGPAGLRGPAEKLQLVLPDRENLVRGTQIASLLLDAQGRLSEFPSGGSINFDASDIHAEVPESALLGAANTTPITLASSRRGFEVVLRATATSTATMMSFTSTLSVDALEFE